MEVERRDVRSRIEKQEEKEEPYSQIIIKFVSWKLNKQINK